MPGVQDTATYHAERRRELHRATFEAAAMRGVITRREEGVLARLRANLGLLEEDVASMEEDVLDSMAERGLSVEWA